MGDKCKMILRDENGYTVVEVLVALALFAGVLLPLGRLYCGVVFNDRCRDKMIALSLAKTELEKGAAGGGYHTGTTGIVWSGKKWTVNTGVKGFGGLKEIVVKVEKQGGRKPLVVLKTMRNDTN